MEERCIEDWIVDVAWEKDLSHVVLATAHNSLLRCKTENLADCSKNKFINVNNKREGCRETKAEKLNKEEQEIHHCQLSNIDYTHALGRHERILIPDGTQQQKLSTHQRPEENVVAKAECAEKCVLFCGQVVMISGFWESVILLAGMVSQQIVLWGPWGDMDDNGRIVPLHRLIGHQGSIFSVNFCPAQSIITTTSDDRSLRVWDVFQTDQNTGHRIKKTLPLFDVEKEKMYWRGSQIVEKLKCYGHGARVWRSLILSSCILSVGEDSKVCVWDHKGKLLMSWKAHDGSCIWSVAATECGSKLVTGGGDGSVKSWSLNLKMSSCAEPLSRLPLISNIQNFSRERDSEDPRELKNIDIIANNDDIEQGSFLKEKEIEEPEIRTLKTIGKERGVKPDFPRCVSLMGMRKFIVVMDSGKVYSWDPKSSSWCLSYEDEHLKNYVVMETCPDQKSVAFGTLSGNMIILELDAGSLKILLKVKVCEGKVFALIWLAPDYIFVCGAAGVMSTWKISEESGALKKCNHILPPCKQRWVSAACVCTESKNGIQNLICGDRAGSLHLYSQEVPEAQHTLRSIHGRNGVTSLTIYNDFIYSTGRDGCVRCLTVQDGHIQVITISRVSSVNWVAKLIFLYEQPMAVCFHDVKLRMWSLVEERAVVEVECGGGHRSWDLCVSEAENELICLFLKDGIPYTFRTTLRDKLMPLIKTAVNTHETMCLQILFQDGCKTVFVTGGEDTTLRLHSVWGIENRRILNVSRSHISSIKALCVVEDGGKRVDLDGEDPTVWIVSAGGRAQVKVWKSTHRECSDKLEVSVNDKLKDCLDENTCRLQNTDVICREVTSHMLRTGSSKTWKSQEPTFDPETRYMDAAAFWVTKTQAVVALASSDGLLRLFQFHAETEKLEIVSSEEWDHCLLKVERLQVPERNILVLATTSGRVLFWDIQAVVNWILKSDVTPHLQLIVGVDAHQSGVNGLAFNYHVKAIKEDIYNITMATGGDDNKLSIWALVVDATKAEKTSISVTNTFNVYGHSAQITGLDWISKDLLVSTSIDQRLIVWKLHSTQKSQHHEENLGVITNSIHGCKTKTTSPEQESEDTSNWNQHNVNVLEPVFSRFTGVPDVKGITFVDLNKNEKSTSRAKNLKQTKRIFVHGVGVQVYDLYFDDDR
ncbi:tRNA (34-2'-O)-methyltransferase regulator WDR6 isoform X2 [Panulirus ornatus]